MSAPEVDNSISRFSLQKVENQHVSMEEKVENLTYLISGGIKLSDPPLRAQSDQIIGGGLTKVEIWAKILAHKKRPRRFKIPLENAQHAL